MSKVRLGLGCGIPCHEQVERDGGRPSALSHDRHIVGVTTNLCNVLEHPLQGKSMKCEQEKWKQAIIHN
jgi:hypothetical protein